MIFSQPIKKEKKLAELNLIRSIITIFKIWTLFTIKIIIYKDKKIIYLYINTLIKEKKISKTFINSSTIIKLIDWKIMQNFDFLVYKINTK